MNEIILDWEDGTSDKIYLRLNPTTGEIGVYSDANNTGVTRARNIVMFGSSTNLSTNQQAKAVLHVVQQINNLIVATFDNTVATYSTIGSGNYE